MNGCSCFLRTSHCVPLKHSKCLRRPPTRSTYCQVLSTANQKPPNPTCRWLSCLLSALCSLLPLPCSSLLPAFCFVLPALCFLFPAPPRPASCSPLPAPCSLLPASCSLLPASCSLLPAPCFLLPASCSPTPAPPLLLPTHACMSMVFCNELRDLLDRRDPREPSVNPSDLGLLPPIGSPYEQESLEWAWNGIRLE